MLLNPARKSESRDETAGWDTMTPLKRDWLRSPVSGNETLTGDIAMKYAALFALLISGTLLSGGGLSQAGPISSAFTYQGRLTDGGDPADGVYDFEFRLFDEAGGGVQIGPTVQRGHTEVVGGYFTVMLDFGEGVFDGEARWLEIAVAPSNMIVKKTVLSPRQAVTAVPYAIHASNSDSTGGYVRTIIVSPADTEIDSGKELIDAINSVPDPNDNKRYLVKIEPGIYDLDNKSLQMREYVDIEGSGQGATVITSTAFDSSDKGTILASGNAELK